MLYLILHDPEGSGNILHISNIRLVLPGWRFTTINICAHLNTVIWFFCITIQGKLWYTGTHTQKWNFIGKCHWTYIGHFQPKSTGQATILWNIPLTSEIPLEHAAEHPSENATDNPRCFPRCRFLACNVHEYSTNTRIQYEYTNTRIHEYTNFCPCDSTNTVLTLTVSTYYYQAMCVYTYIYIYIHIYTHIHILYYIMLYYIISYYII